jgi:hypothetical protein
MRKLAEKHGMSHTRLYRTWHHMLERCECKTNSSYPQYGEKGISVCAEWHFFEAFRDWAFSSGYSDNLTIDRIDGIKGYFPENCRWATYGEQNNNLSRNHFIIAFGEKKTISQFARQYGINKETLRYRIQQGILPEEALKLISPI